MMESSRYEGVGVVVRHQETEECGYSRYTLPKPSTYEEARLQLDKMRKAMLKHAESYYGWPADKVEVEEELFVSLPPHAVTHIQWFVEESNGG